MRPKIIGIDLSFAHPQPLGGEAHSLPALPHQ